MPSPTRLFAALVGEQDVGGPGKTVFCRKHGGPVADEKMRIVESGMAGVLAGDG